MEKFKSFMKNRAVLVIVAVAAGAVLATAYVAVRAAAAKVAKYLPGSSVAA